MSKKYILDDLVRVAKRENNAKRAYLYVDPLQGKHLPVEPGRAMELFGSMADMLEKAYPREKLLLIGFAETATAIGAAIACKADNVVSYMTTTREDIPGGEYLYFTESHSHATEQRLVTNGLEPLLDRVDRVVFAEDEVTTGNTIEKLICALKEKYPGKAERFGIISILNSMPADRIEELKSRSVDCLYVCALPREYRASCLGDFVYEPLRTDFPTHEAAAGSVSVFSGRWEPRTVCSTAAIREKLSLFAGDFFARERDLENCGSVLFLGTEEFMFPGMLLGAETQERFPGISVKTHATTRSPIEISAAEAYPLHSRWKLRSFYDPERVTHIYNLEKYDRVYIVTDAPDPESAGAKSLASALREAGNEDIRLIRWADKTMSSSYKSGDVDILLKDISGLVQPLPASEREKYIQSGTHYCEMLPLEYKPSEKYMETYYSALEDYSGATARGVGILAEKLFRQKGENLAVVSLARAGIPIGILIKRYLKNKYGVEIDHYAVSIIRGRGIDKNAMDHILRRHAPSDIQFVDGWIGKGAILRQLKEALRDYPLVSPELAVVSDPANLTENCGTHEDILIPSSCLNATVTGLISRTFLRDDIIGPGDFHGAAYYPELEGEDMSEEFLLAIEKHFDHSARTCTESVGFNGVAVVEEIAREYDIEDINFIKPGIGEATRVLLRRVPWKVIVNRKYADSAQLKHIYQLAREKNVPVELSRTELGSYKVCGIIKKLSDV